MKTETGWATGIQGTNTSGFSALPAGYYEVYSQHTQLGNMAAFWCPDFSGNNATAYSLSSDSEALSGYAFNAKYSYFSTRCIKD